MTLNEALDIFRNFTTKFLKDNIDSSGKVGVLFLHPAALPNLSNESLKEIVDSVATGIKSISHTNFDPKVYKKSIDKYIRYPNASALFPEVKLEGKDKDIFRDAVRRYGFPAAGIGMVIKSSTALNDDYKKILAGRIYHEAIHLLFGRGVELYNQEYLADAMSSKMSGKESTLRSFLEMPPYDYDKDHPSSKDRVKAVINETYSDPVERIIAEVKRCADMGLSRNWAGALYDKLPSDFIAR